MLGFRSLVVSLALLATNIPAGLGRLTGIPTVPFSASGQGSYSLANIKYIVVDSQHADAVDTNGETLIPPTLLEFATTFAGDLKSSLSQKVEVAVKNEALPQSIFLTIGDAADYLDAAGRETSEGYTLSVTSSGIVVTGASPLGAWWGTRSILQQAILSDGSIPLGKGVDSPGWGTRGMMLDAGRHYYPPEFLVEMCSYMSFFKQNTFHVHLSDNLYNNVDIYSTERSLELYARFRLWSDNSELSGLNKYKNESYTQDQFEYIQSSCAARGVTIIPEIEAPGHALVIVQWKPELGLSDDLSLLNISHPDTIPTMKTIWGTFLPWFHTKSVHIGADEYTAGATDYNYFVNEMADYIAETSGKSMRIWGTFPPNHTEGYNNIYTNVTIQHWEFFEDNPLFDYIENNYTVINSDDAYYVVNKWSGSYPQIVNLTRTFHGSPSGGPWYPYIFDMTNSTNNPPRSTPLVPGEIAALWNDYGANATVYSEAYYAWRDGIPALGDKQWGGDLKESEFYSVSSSLRPYIPGQNLDRSIPSNTSTIFNYTFSSTSSHTSNTECPDSSSNDHSATTTCKSTQSSTLKITDSCSIITSFSSKGRNYTLSLSFKINTLDNNTVSDGGATLISGSDSSLVLTPNITLFASGNYYSLNSTLPVGQWIDLDVIGRGNKTFAKVSTANNATAAEQEFIAKVGINGEYFVWAPIAVEAPLKQIGGNGTGWTGEVKSFSLSSEA
ncbi:putative glycosyl hydrolase family 20 [Phaeomoniella chlamydospora]|uniref:beta-N-acetylhexosaminidase n=1 Tax=Phaeomoniella chlamydospora TaxID=158046 RepID=A0A0G2GCS8_PHACM|nr:putative glycosyl hydrolase family 20 [Phaeomoniella chlamydospora]